MTFAELPEDEEIDAILDAAWDVVEERNEEITREYDAATRERLIAQMQGRGS